MLNILHTFLFIYLQWTFPLRSRIDLNHSITEHQSHFKDHVTVDVKDSDLFPCFGILVYSTLTLMVKGDSSHFWSTYP